MSKKCMVDTPPMGWNSWDCYGAGVTEEILLANARYMAERLKPFGWEYIVCDIQWYEPLARGTKYNDGARLCLDTFSRVIPAPNRFPSSRDGTGFKKIADAVHSLGLKFGIHMMRGIPRQAVTQKTPIVKAPLTAADIADTNSYCTWNTDMYGVNPDADGAYEYYLSVFTMYAEWGVDFVKVDDIANTELFPNNPYSAKKEIELIRRAIDNSGRNMVLSLSPGPAPIEEAVHLSENADMWRLTGDFWDKWSKLKGMFDYCEKWYPYVGKGGWPDCDMLPIGRLKIFDDSKDANRFSRFTPNERRTMMSLWCIFRSPLMIGGELTDDSEEIRELATNAEILAMHRDGRDPHPTLSKKRLCIFVSHTEDGKSYAAIFNLGRIMKFVRVPQTLLETSDTRTVKELWSGRKLRFSHGKLRVAIPPHGAVVLKFY